MIAEELNIQQAIKHHQAHRFDQAAQLYHEALKQNPERQEALYGLGMLAQQQGDNQTAEHWLLDALRVQSDSVQTWFGLGNLYQTQGKLLEAAEAYWQAMGLRPDSAPIFNNLGYTLQQLEQWDEAALCYQKALELQPGLIEVEVNLGNVLHNLGKLTADQQAHLATLNYQFGVTRYQHSDFKSAQPYLRQAIALQSDFVDAHAYLGMTLVHQDELTTGTAYCQAALKLNPSHELAQRCLQQIDQQNQLMPAFPTEITLETVSPFGPMSALETSNDVKLSVQIKSDVEILRKISGTIWSWAKTGFSIVDQSTFDKRYNACMQCPNLENAPKKLLYRVITANSSNEKICTLCGCIVATKARITSESCPDPHPIHSNLNRWEDSLIQ